MQKYKSLITGSLIAAMIIVTPLVTFADNDNKDKKDNDNKEIQVREIKSEKNQKEHSWFNSNWFISRKDRITSAPVISNVVVDTNKTYKTKIKWDTSVRSNSFVWFSKTSPVDTSIKPTIKRNDRVLSHKIELKKLESNTKYYVVVGSANGQNKTLSTETSFTTGVINENNNNLSIKSLEGKKIINVGDTAKVMVNVSDKGNGNLSFSADWGDTTSSNQSSLLNKTIQSATFNHIYNTIGTYTATFTVTNNDGKTDSKSMEIKVVSIISDITSPIISNIETKVNKTDATISWITNEPTTSSIFYNATTTVDVNNSNTPKVVDSKLVTKHSLNIPLLVSSTLYHFIIKSVDAANNAVTSIEYAFHTN